MQVGKAGEKAAQRISGFVESTATVHSVINGSLITTHNHHPKRPSGKRILKRVLFFYFFHLTLLSSMHFFPLFPGSDNACSLLTSSYK
jgi:hypothetical protein